MKLSEQTFKILSNFASINPNIVIEPGNVLKTFSESKTVYGKAYIDETFDKEISFYNLKEFLSLANNIHEDSECDFKDHHVLIKSSNSQTRYRYSDKEVLTYPKRDITIDEPEIEFQLPKETLNKALKAASVLNFEFLIFDGKDGKLELLSEDIDEGLNSSESNQYLQTIASINKNISCRFILPIGNVSKIISGDYLVSLSSKRLAKFFLQDTRLEYYMTLNKKSYYEET